ncbi:antibiotic biosynthesis monooxygenase family protein [Sporosarcina highlanderae]|uniref:Antibiotic biosynthesis monooxygenase n=1 Tax=Sporosarcina highlanderae TaxID=3035916 RepID=A0ABT8JRF3_9BACL|nr:antibiotic biosynthesis monooxygenase [Sporosarcina highlanderae]MDN4606764.1 antibiotic biosynthesis monooxygenase [Sporosarcina highlanderae]
MYLYMTSGTQDFMEKLQQRYKDKGMILMHGGGQSLLLYETEAKSVFQAPRRYEVISSAGVLKDEGFFVCNNVAVTDEGRPVFEHRFSSLNGEIDSQQGFIAFRLLRPLDSDTYVVLTQWEKAADFDLWKNSPSFKNSHQSIDNKEFATNTTHIFSSAPYITTYTARKKENEI